LGIVYRQNGRITRQVKTHFRFFCSRQHRIRGCIGYLRDFGKGFGYVRPRKE